MKNNQPSKFDLKYTLLAVILIVGVILVLLATRKNHSNPSETETARKARQSIKDARSW